MDLDKLIKALELGELTMDDRLALMRVVKDYRTRKYHYVVEMSESNFKRYYTEILNKEPISVK